MVRAHAGGRHHFKHSLGVSILTSLYGCFVEKRRLMLAKPVRR
jgi:hypothetical protein